MDPIISVVVPVYQVENYLWTCLDSLAVQAQEGIEFLLIDDGSTDQSGEICDQYASNDPRFLVFHKDRREGSRGAGSARNYGIDRARGKYLMFVDSDDWVEQDFCKTALNCATEQGADMVVFSGTVRLNSSKQISPLHDPIPGLQTREEAMFQCVHGWWTVPWNKLYARELFDGIRFPENRMLEDIGTIYKLIWSAGRIWYIDRILYHYRVRHGNQTHTRTPRMKSDCFLQSLQRARDLRSWNYEPEKMELAAVKNALLYCIEAGKCDSDDWELAAGTVRDSRITPLDLTGEERKLLETLRGETDPV